MYCCTELLRRKRRFNPFYVSFQIVSRKLVCHNYFVYLSKVYRFVLYMACGVMIFTKNLKLFEKNLSFFSLLLIFIGYCCSIDLKGQSEHSGLRVNTSIFYCMGRGAIFAVAINLSDFY